MKYLPNALTIGRILVTPVLLVLLISNTLVGISVAFVLFVAAAISDYLDGKLARTMKVRSRLGQFLDPIADKVLVLGTFTALWFLLPHIVTWWAVLLIALRDIAVTALRSWMEARGRSLRTLPIAKAKTTFQLTFLISLLFVMIAAKIPGAVGGVGRWILDSPIPFVLLLLVVAVTIGTGFVYFMHQEPSDAPL